MALGRGTRSDATKTMKRPSEELLCQWIKTMATTSQDVTKKQNKLRGF
jgi:hypothetical protein